jgi:hypothetical protein
LPRQRERELNGQRPRKGHAIAIETAADQTPLLRIGSDRKACPFPGAFFTSRSSRLRLAKIRQSGVRPLDVSCLAPTPAHFFTSTALNQDSHDEFSAEVSTWVTIHTNGWGSDEPDPDGSWHGSGIQRSPSNWSAKMRTRSAFSARSPQPWTRRVCRKARSMRSCTRPWLMTMTTSCGQS